MTGARGSSALLGFPEILMEMRLPSGTQAGQEQRQRLITCRSRIAEDHVADMLFEMGPEGLYRPIGARADATKAARMDAIAEMLAAASEPLTYQEVHEAWDEAEHGTRPSRRTIELLMVAGLEEGKDGRPPRWRKEGSGRRGEPFRFRPVDSFAHSPPPLKGGTLREWELDAANGGQQP